MKWWRSVLAMELRKILAYRSDFWITFLGYIFTQLFVARALWQSIFESQGISSMEGYTLPMLTLYYLIVPIGSRILTGENIGFLSREIYDGGFTRYLIYPLSVFQYKAITYLTYSAFYAVQLILLYFLFHTFYAESPSNILQIITGTGLFFLAAMTYVTLAMLVELTALWADNTWSLMVMLRFFVMFFGGGLLPLAFFPEWAQHLLQWTPFPYLIGLPTRATMGAATFIEIKQGILVLIAWGLFFSYLLKLVWKRGQKHYTGVGI